MSDIVVDVENIGKRYRIGGATESYGTLRDTIAATAAAPLNRLRGRGAAVRDDFWALQHVSFELKAGDVLGIIGHNGAGKSTLLKILSRITEPTTGRATIHGRVGSLLEVGTGFHPELTGRENIYLNGAVLGMTKRDIDKRFDEIVEFSGIEQFLNTPVKRYSSGMYTRLAFSVAAHLEPEVLIVDEVLAVGDAEFQKKSLGKMGDVAKEGRTVLFVSHNMAAIQSLCKKAIHLRDGEVSAHDDALRVVNDYLTQARFKASNGSDSRRALNPRYGIALTKCTSFIDKGPEGRQNLRVEIDLESTRVLRRIGIGISLFAADGTRVSSLGPSLTNCVIDTIDGHCHCSITCDEVDTYLAGGDYSISIWVAIPRAEKLVSMEDAATVSLEPRDVYGTGMFFEAHRNGVVPLPVRFSVQDGLPSCPIAS